MNEKEKYGQYMTPKLIADFMCSLIQHDKTAKILEPSCGKGAFLDALDDCGYHNNFGYEIDSELIKRDNVTIGSFVSANIEPNYDVVIGNPPYIRWKNLEEELKEELYGNDLFNKYLNALNDYSAFFILKSVEVLNDGGELIFITPDYWLDTTESQNLRDYLCNHGYMSDLYLFKETPIFKDVNVSLQIFRFVKSKDRNNRCVNIHLYNNEKRSKDFDNIIECLKNKKGHESVVEYSINQFQKGERWYIASNEEIEEIQQLESACSNGLLDYITLEDVCEIGNGMVSGLDKAFQISNYNSLNKEEKAHTIKVIKAKNLSAYLFDEITPYIFLEDKPITEDILIAKYPHFYEKLSIFREDLEKRYSYGRDIKYWNWVFLRNFKDFTNFSNKILVPCKERISNKDRHRFALAYGDIFPTQDVSAIMPFDTTKESIEYICAHLNSIRVFNWIKHKGIIKGNIVEFSRAPLASIPFRRIDFSNKGEKEIHDSVTDLVREYYKTKDTNLLNKIDSLISKLY